MTLVVTGALSPNNPTTTYVYGRTYSVLKYYIIYGDGCPFPLYDNSLLQIPGDYWLTANTGGASH